MNHDLYLKIILPREPVVQTDVVLSDVIQLVSTTLFSPGKAFPLKGTTGQIFKQLRQPNKFKSCLFELLLCTLPYTKWEICN